MHMSCWYLIIQSPHYTYIVYVVNRRLVRIYTHTTIHIEKDRDRSLWQASWWWQTDLSDCHAVVVSSCCRGSVWCWGVIQNMMVCCVEESFLYSDEWWAMSSRSYTHTVTHRHSCTYTRAYTCVHGCTRALTHTYIIMGVTYICYDKLKCDTGTYVYYMSSTMVRAVVVEAVASWSCMNWDTWHWSCL